MKAYLTEMRAVLVAIAGTIAFLWIVAKPHAENFIKDTVNVQGYAKKYQLDEANKTIRQNQAIANDVKNRSIRMETKQETILQLLQELRQQQRRGIRN